MSVRCVGIHWNSTKSSGYEVALDLIAMLRARNIQICVNSELADHLNVQGLRVEAFEECGLMFVLGGDGTILSALDRAIPFDIPILGINLGRLGFLTELEINDLNDEVLDRALSGDYRIDERMTMRVEGQDELRMFALNDIVITRSTPSVRILSLEYEADGAMIDRISGDGLIVATATGSTAYSLSSGGPIVLPGLDCFVLTPICPHTLNARPVIVSSNHRITVRMRDDRGGAQAVLDGRRIIPLNDRSREITICRSNRQARFIRLMDRNSFGLLRSKLSEWTH